MVRFEYFQGRFAQEADQSGPRVDQDRTRRALSDGLLIFFVRPSLTGEKPKILPNRPVPFRKTLSDSSIKRTRAHQGWIKIELDELYLMDYLFFSQDPALLAKNPKYCQNSQNVLKSFFDSFRAGTPTNS